ncbi:MAG TPA: hypothetical protein VFB54_13305 [Burkholderiales bacterium]|nr:hypothetical protein [Burkholderiales bacterium]
MTPEVHRSAISRRTFLRTGLALAGSALLRNGFGAVVNAPALLDNELGGLRVLPAGGVFCGGVLATEGHEIVHALLHPWLPLAEGWAFVDAHLKAANRPAQALCGMELRTPEQLTVEAFRAFNAPYIEQLRKRALTIGNYSAVCRTNVVPASEPPKEAMLHAFSYSVPSTTKVRTFCISGTADIDARGKAVAEGDVSPAGMRARASHCLDQVGERLAQLDLEWPQVTHIDLCIGRDPGDLMRELILPSLKGAASRGVRIHHARPPLIGTEVELECRGVLREVILHTA